MDRIDLGPCKADVLRRGSRFGIVILPGARYSAQAPLLWFAREAALARDAGVLLVLDEFSFDTDAHGWVHERAVKALDASRFEACVVIGKSLASFATGLLADRRLPAIWLTPLLDQALVVAGLARVAAPTLLVGGTADSTWRPEAIPRRGSIETVQLRGLDHSLQLEGDVDRSLQALRSATVAIERFLDARWGPHDTAAAIDYRPSGSGELCRRLLERLPDWFGIPEAIDEYATRAETTEAVVALADGHEVGLLTLLRHARQAAEIDVMAVAPEHHRRGIGRSMLEHAEELLAREGVEYLQVKTLSDSVDYEPYARTRAFYESCGFRALQVFPDLWDADNPALQLVKRLGVAAAG